MARNKAVAKAQREKFVDAARRAEAEEIRAPSEAETKEIAGAMYEDRHQPHE